MILKTYHQPNTPYINFFVPFYAQNYLWGAVKVRHHVPSMLLSGLSHAGFTKVIYNRVTLSDGQWPRAIYGSVSSDFEDSWVLGLSFVYLRKNSCVWDAD